MDVYIDELWFNLLILKVFFIFSICTNKNSFAYIHTNKNTYASTINFTWKSQFKCKLKECVNCMSQKTS